MKQIDNLRQYIEYIILALIIIFIYKNFDGHFFKAVYNAFLPVIIGGVLAYFLQPLVYVLEMKIDSINNGQYTKISHIIASIFVFVIFILIIVLLLMLIIPALVNYVVTPNDKFQPMNANFGILPKLDCMIRDKQERYRKLAEISIKEMNQLKT